MVHINNYAKPMEKRGERTYYKWRIFVDEASAILKQIREVSYTLHPTFPQPNQVRDDPNDGFALETAGWGEFTILIDVKYQDGKVEEVPYLLDLNKGWPDGN